MLLRSIVPSRLFDKDKDKTNLWQISNKVSIILLKSDSPNDLKVEGCGLESLTQYCQNKSHSLFITDSSLNFILLQHWRRSWDVFTESGRVSND